MDILEKISFSKKERIAFIYLLSFLLIGYAYSILMKPQSCSEIQITTLNAIIPGKAIKSNHISNSKDSIPIQKKIRKIVSKSKNQKSKTHITQIKLSFFDPNQIDSLRWITLGVPHYNIKTILNFKRKGGKFYDCGDLKKIYGLNESLLNELLPFCKIENGQKQKTIRSVKKININDADSTELCKIYGIGPKLSSRILKFRKRIGGFHKVEQLLEVWGVEKEVLDNNSTLLFCDGIIERININTIDIKGLNKHIYFNYKQSKTIINYRNQNGPFPNIQAINDIIIVNDSMYNKIKPYLTID